MSSIKEYFQGVAKGLSSLVKGMEVTGKELVTKKLTECYPENRATLEIPERFRAELTLKYDSEGRHKCIGCGICQMNCPKEAISFVNGRAHIDPDKCVNCGKCMKHCPQKIQIPAELKKIAAELNG